MRASYFALLLFALPAYAGGVYTWTDDQGVVHYTDRPVGPEEAKQVPGMELGASASAASGTSKLTLQSLQGTWCQYEIATSIRGNAPIASHIEWTFNGAELKYHDLDSGLTIPGRFVLKEQTIVTDQSTVGNPVIRTFSGNEMAIGSAESPSRFRRGSCAAPSGG